MGKVDKDIETLVSEGTVMPDGRRADTARAQLEYKNQLKNAGDIYVGTGDYIVNSDGTGNEIYITEGKNIQTAIREDANRKQGLRLGEDTSSSYSNIVELGIGAKAEANSACQIGAGTNNVANSLQFRDRTVVNGKGEIVGDYPLGFSARVMERPGDNWPMEHADLQGGTFVTDWSFTETNGYKSEVAFVSILNEKEDRANLNLVIDGNIYVDEGKRRVYAQGDVINADTLKYISLRDKSDLINADGTLKIKGCVAFEVGENEVVLDDYHEIPSWSKGIIVGVYDFSIIYAAVNQSGCIYYNASGKNWSNGYPTNATNAEKTSFTNTTFTQIKPATEFLRNMVGTYQFYNPYFNFTFLLYFKANTIYSVKSPIFVSDKTSGNIKANDKFYLEFEINGKIKWFKEKVSITYDGSFTSYSSTWEEITGTDSDFYYIYYRKID